MTTHQNMLWEMMITLALFSTLVMIYSGVTGAFADMLNNPLIFKNYETQETWPDCWVLFYVRAPPAAAHREMWSPLLRRRSSCSLAPC